jgi:hypothetical protein
VSLRIPSLLSIGALAVVLLAGCTPAALTASAEDIADLAEGALEEEVGSRPEIDCGTGQIALKVGLVVDCTLTDPVSGTQFDAPVTIETIEGTDYTIGVQVGDAPIGEPTPEATVEPDPSGNPTVPGADIAELAAGALEGVVGFLPELACPEEQVTIVVGNVTYCSFDDADGTAHDVAVTITEFDGSNYTINAEVIS